MNEKQLQAAVIAHWRNRGKPNTLVAAIPNARAFGQAGLTKGLPDLIVITPTINVAFLELKTARGKLSPAQKWIMGLMRDCDCLAAVAYGLDEALETLTEWGAIKDNVRAA